MSKNKNKYLCVDCRDIYTIDYALVEVNGDLMPYTGDNCDDLFGEHGIPFDMRKVFITQLPLSKCVKEIFTGLPLKFNKQRYYDYSISGEMKGDYPRFRFENAIYCETNDILEFAHKLKQEELVDNYLKCLSEMFKLNISMNMDNSKNDIGNVLKKTL